VTADNRGTDRDKNAEISRHYGNTLVRELRVFYGKSFASEHPDTSTLREVINRLDEVSLSNLHRDHEMGQLNHASDSGKIWGRRPL
jgi:hypothetical protein